MQLFPNTNFHSLNLDWILSQIRKAVYTVNGQAPDDQGNVNLPTVAGVTSVNGVGADSSGNVQLTPADVGALPTSYQAPVQSVNQKTGYVMLTPADVGALPASYQAPVDSVNGQTGAVILDASDVGALPDTYAAPVETVNGRDGNVVLDAAAVGALPDTTVIPSRTSQLVNDSGFLTAQQAGAVTSVNGQVGAVVLDAAAVSALPATTVIPTLTSQLVNDSGYITQAQASPVSSVNGEVGAVVLDAADVGATPAGQGVPSGGTIGQVIGKTGSVDYATGWIDPPSGATWEAETLTTNLILYRQGNMRMLSASGCTVANPIYTLAAGDRPAAMLSMFGLQGTTSSNRAGCFFRVFDTGEIVWRTFSGAILSSGEGWGSAFWTV